MKIKTERKTGVISLELYSKGQLVRSYFSTFFQSVFLKGRFGREVRVICDELARLTKQLGVSRTVVGVCNSLSGFLG